jgi:hypothetical protein
MRAHERKKRVELGADAGAQSNTEEKCLLQHAPRLRGSVREDRQKLSTYLKTSFRRVRLWSLRGAISLSSSFATCFACPEGRMSTKSDVIRLGRDCLAITMTRLPLPPGILAFESIEFDFMSGQEVVCDCIDEYPEARTFVVAFW